MAEKIKKFFAKKKADAKFKLAGPGHKLSAASSTDVVGPASRGSDKKQPSRMTPTEATKNAAEAALARMSIGRENPAFNTSLAAIQAQVRRELENEKKQQQQQEQRKGESEFVVPEETKPVDSEVSPHLAVSGVYFRCPLVSDEVLDKEEWKGKIREFLYEQLEEERGLTACLIINSCNYNRTKVSECVATLCRYLDNIIANPEETKFHRIRCQNATYADKVQPILGSDEFLQATGFSRQQVDHNGAAESFWVWSPANVDGVDTMRALRETLTSEERVELEIDRNVQVLSPAQASARIELPRAFYAISAEEIRREQQLKKEAADKQLQLRTKAMREKDEMREMRKYKFALIRVRFPDGLYLQGTFSVYEKFGEVLEFIRENLEVDAPFEVSTPTGQKLGCDDAESNLVALRLVPATILMFKWNALVEEELGGRGAGAFLKPEVMMLMKSL